MFSFSKRKITNKLTALFNHGNVPTVLDVLVNEDLLPSVKNEAAELVEWIFVTPPRGTTKKGHIDELIEWALENKSDPKINDPDRQINLRAGKVFSSVTKEIHKRALDDKRLIEKLDNFPKSLYAREAIPAGNWCSIYAAINRYTNNMPQQGQDTWLQVRLKQGLLDDIMKNIDILAYRSLLGSLISDTTGVLAKEYEGNLGIFISTKLLNPFSQGLKDKNEKQLVFVISLLESLIIEHCNGLEILREFSVIEQLLKIFLLFRGKRGLGMYKVCHLLTVIMKDRKRSREEKAKMRAYYKAYEKEIENYDIATKALIFPVFYREMFHQKSMMDYFFDSSRDGFENNSSFSQAYIHAFQRFDGKTRDSIIKDTDIIDRICKALKGNHFSSNFFIVRLAEIIAESNCEISGEWNPMIANLISAMETLRKESKEVHADDIPQD